MYYPVAGNVDLFLGYTLISKKIQTICRKAVLQLIEVVKQWNSVRIARFKQA